MGKVEITHVPYRGTAQSTHRSDRKAASRCRSAPFRPRSPISARADARARRHWREAQRAAAGRADRRQVGLAGYEASLWQAIVAPAATPAAIVARFNRAVALVLNNSDVRDTLAEQGVEAEPGSPEALAARIRDDVKKWREVITSAGVRTP